MDNLNRWVWKKYFRWLLVSCFFTSLSVKFSIILPSLCFLVTEFLVISQIHLLFSLFLLSCQAFLDFRCNVIEKRARFKLSQLQERRHTIEVCYGNCLSLLIWICNLFEVPIIIIALLHILVWSMSGLADLCSNTEVNFNSLPSQIDFFFSSLVMFLMFLFKFSGIWKTKYGLLICIT